ncbi:MAG: hypothetical protein R2705_23305 [Ilumatobacteraceae bacterium]
MACARSRGGLGVGRLPRRAVRLHVPHDRAQGGAGRHSGGDPAPTRRLAAAMVLLWTASDWPIRDLADHWLVSVHLFQHMVLGYFLHPCAVGHPEWFLRLLVGGGPATECCGRCAGRCSPGCCSSWW